MFELHTVQEEEARELHTLLVRAELGKKVPPTLREASWGHLARRTIALFSSERSRGASVQEELNTLRAVAAGESALPSSEVPTLVRNVLSRAAHWIGRRSAARCARFELPSNRTLVSATPTKATPTQLRPTRRIGQTQDGREVTIVATQVGDYIVRAGMGTPTAAKFTIQ